MRLHDRRRCSSAASPRPQIHLSMERHMDAASGCAGTASSARRSSAVTGPSTTTPRPPPGWRCASCERSRNQARGVEIRLLRRLPADAARPARMSCWRSRASVEFAEFHEATSRNVEGPYDLSLVEGSITTAHDAERIQAGPAGLQDAGHDRRLRHRRRHPGAAQLRRRRGVRRRRSTPRREYISTLATSTPIAAHVTVDFELHGCPINKRQLLEVVKAFLHGRKPGIPSTSVCTECKRRGTVCVTVAHGTPCLGPVTHAGCGALCPAYDRGCYGCFGPMETPNTGALIPLLRCPGPGRGAGSSGSSAPSTPARSRS